MINYNKIKKPIRVLHVVSKMDLAGVENWLIYILRHIDRELFKLDFLVHDQNPGKHDAEAKRLGSRIIYCPFTRWPLTYANNFKKILHENGPYDIIHAHQALSGFILRWASQSGVPVRIAHSHQTDILRNQRASIFRRWAILISQRLIRRYANAGLAASQIAALSRYGKNWKSDCRWRVMYCGIDLSPFRNTVNKAEVRKNLGIPEDAWVVGNVGRLAHQKNQIFALEIGKYLSYKIENFRLLLVGEGPLRMDLENKVAEYGLKNKVLFAGLREDVPRLLKGAMDTFLFPSLYEGLPLALIEAQAAGLPCIISDTITDEASIVPLLIKKLSLKDSPEKWGENILSTYNRYGMPNEREAFQQVEQSPFNIEFSARELTKLYLELISNKKV